MRKVAMVFAWTLSVSHEVEAQLCLVARVSATDLRADDLTTASVHNGLLRLSLLYLLLVRGTARILAKFILLVVHAIIFAEFALVVVVDPVFLVIDKLRFLLLRLVVEVHELILQTLIL